MTVVLGDHDIVPGKNLERYEVVRTFKKSFTDVLKGDDIMLLKLGKEAVLGGKVRTVNIADKRHRGKPDTKCLVEGWGKTKEADSDNELLALNVSTVDIQECRKAWTKKYGIRLPPNIICAGGYKQRAGVCKGDSGGPLVCNSVAVGIVSFVKTCTFGADIINGKRANKNSLFFMASIQTDGKHKCGGFLIDQSYVLTAAHCGASGNMTVILGTHNIDPRGSNLRRYSVQNKHKHPLYQNAINGNDIMLLKVPDIP
ncbi:Mast cell protease 1A [Triplophysa tibetana]|uniref:trypsin n=1 Tax=Triplophysa tibetana TaxID=1572043 RepID=A0A5A9NV87_9TELE|nr:Mast cell protease 1A [Triplophysa tibetana]